uniref:Uncharacterized protein n=1 Tax=Hyaloperonospora arabidopsidis (strain Emoy2) TaxID=559515 RepID=M4BJK0_HYAAE
MNPRPELEKALEFLYRVKGDGVSNEKGHDVPGNRTIVENYRKTKNDSTRTRHHEQGLANISVGEGRRFFLCNKAGHIKKYYPNRRRQQDTATPVQETQGTLNTVSKTIQNENAIHVMSCWTAQGIQGPGCSTREQSTTSRTTTRFYMMCSRAAWTLRCKQDGNPCYGGW